MKHYLSITKDLNPKVEIIAFDKLDSALRAWLDKLKTHCKNDIKLFEELS